MCFIMGSWTLRVYAEDLIASMPYCSVQNTASPRLQPGNDAAEAAVSLRASESSTPVLGSNVVRFLN